MTHTIPVRVNTIYGREQFDILAMQRYEYRGDSRSADEFKARCFEDHGTVVHYLNYFLEDEDMSRKYKMDETDKEGWSIFNKMSDQASLLKYFAGNFYKETV